MTESKVRFVTFNVCGIKGILSRSAQWVTGKSLESMFEELKADIICFQETKIQASDITKDMAIVPHFNSFFTFSLSRKGYSGVAIYVRDTIRVHKAEEGLTGMLNTGTPGNIGPYRYKANCLDPSIYPEGISASRGRYLDEQGRSITLDLGSLIVIGLYCPADSQGNMGEFREEFYQLLDWRVAKYRELGREVLVLGDLNVAREPRDSAPICDEYKRQKKEIDLEEWKYGSVPRKALNDWVEQMGFIDTSRLFHESRMNMYTCWDQQKNCRPANFGSRIDYILVSSGVKCVDADIMPDLVGSDHCPVYADIMLECEPQGSYKVPYLSRSLSDRWNQSVKFLFQKGITMQTKNINQNGQKRPREPQDSVPAVDQTESSLTPPTPPPSSSTAAPLALGVPNAKRQMSISQMFGSSNNDWKKVSRKLEPPLCQHGEPCIMKKSMKPPRKGEHFWICSRSMGGKSDQSGKFRCKTFIWDTERN